MNTETCLRKLMLFGLCLLTTSLHAEPAEFNYGAFEDAVDDMSRRLETLQQRVDQTRFNAEDWLDTLDYDAEEVLRAVSSEIVFQPYEGVMRGVNGTLQSRAGNSADQALLLAFLLNSAGYDARIVRARLSEADAMRLLGTLDSPSREESLDYLAKAAREEGVPMDSDVRTVDPADTKVARQVAGASERILGLLKAEGLDLEAADVTDELLAQTRSYFWVQHRDGPGDDWQDAHPAFAGAAPPQIAPEEFYANQIPDAYLHTLTVSAWLTQKLGNKIEDARIMGDVTQPVANLHGKAIRFSNFPDGLSPERLDDLAGAVASTRILMPTLNGGTAPGAQAFDLNGFRVDPFAASAPAASLFSTLADKLEGAASSVAEEENLVNLEAVWLQFTFTAPDGTSTTSRRYLIAPGTQFENDQDRVWPLITDHVYVVNAGYLPIDYLADRYLANVIGGNDTFKALAHKLFFPEAGTPLPDAPPTDIGPLAQYRLMEANPASSGQALRVQPSLLGYRTGHRDAETAFFGVDVVANATRELQIRNGRVFADKRASVRQGVWDTGVEKVPGLRVNPKSRANAVEILASADAQDIDMHVITSPAALDDVDLSPAAAHLAKAELENGYALILPETTPQGVAMSGWWRVRPDTGETLGMTADGYGAELVEYLVDMIGIGMGLIDAVKGLRECEEQPTMDTRLCCLMQAHLNTTTGNAIGSVGGAVADSSTGFAFTIGDKVTSAILEAPSVMPQADLNCEALPQTEW
jgi:hypothetical protein